MTLNRNMLSLLRTIVILLTSSTLIAMDLWQGHGLTEQELRGKEVYEKGASPSGGKVIPFVNGMEMPPGLITCSGCHGKDGKGGEGALIPPDIRWETLTNAIELPLASGRVRSSYNGRSIKKAIAMGIDASGNKLHSAMPKYQMPMKDMTDLIAYLKVIEKTEPKQSAK